MKTICLCQNDKNVRLVPAAVDDADGVGGGAVVVGDAEQHEAVVADIVHVQSYPPPAACDRRPQAATVAVVPPHSPAFVHAGAAVAGADRGAQRPDTVAFRRGVADTRVG